MNIISITGRLTRDPDYTPANGDKSQYAKFTVADDKFYGDGTSFFDCIVFGKQADIVERFLEKGRQVHVIGCMEQSNPYLDKSGNKRRSWSVRVFRVQFLGSKSDSTKASPPPAQTEIGPLQEEDVPF